MDPNETKIFTAILIAATILGIILLYFVVSLVRHQRHIIQLQKDSLLVEINTLEKERKRVVADLHDELGPLLSVAKIQVSSLDTQLPQDLQLIEKAGGHMDEVLNRIRTICNELMPQVLIRKGLVIALEEFLSEVNRQGRLQLSLTVSERDLFDQSSEVHVYRIIQEIVNNALKHSGATVLQLQIRSQGNKISITATDNGKGFVTEEQERDGKGLGLKNITSRVDILHGELYLQSLPGQGTTYTIEIPKQLK